ncbi:MAG: hypothetical protein HFF05_05760 [Oscillospiraceae bacterium]|nr:hypothetical protein [Oscillospiraceae bacterium]
MAELFLPVLSHFQNNNPWLGSMGRLRYRIIPTVAEREEESLLTAQVWEGPWAYEFSTVEETAVFPLTQEGLQALSPWLAERGAQVNARPKRTMAEDAARRKEPTA